MLAKNQRKCPHCDKVLTYSEPSSANRAEKEKSVCRACMTITGTFKAKITKSKEKLIIKLHAAGLSNKEIMAKLNISRKPVNRVFKEHGLIRNKKPKTSKYPINSKYRICSDCNLNLDINNFLIYSTINDIKYRLGHCYKCRNIKAKYNIKRNIDRYLNYLYSNTKSRCKPKNIECDIPNNYLIKLFKYQKGKCFYTDVPLKMNENISDRSGMSIDRVDSSKGYIVGNIVLCSRRINTVKNDLSLDEIKMWMPGWYKRIALFYKRAGVLLNAA